MLAYFDTFSGASGDMILGALLDAGLGLESLRGALAKLAVPGYELAAAKVHRKGLAGTKCDVKMLPGSPMPQRGLGDIVRILDASDIPHRARDAAKRVFGRLADAEAKVHGTTPDRVHFHEVGAVDAIVDITGACIGLEMLGVTEVRCSPIPVGSGTVRADHGVMPIPAPATAELLRSVNATVTTSPETGELTTPTGAAILTTLTGGFGPMPAMTVTAVGYGAGTREGRHTANLLRMVLGERVAAPASTSADERDERDEVFVLEANIDDISAEIVGYAFDKLFEAGALDVYAVPIQMKKSRPGLCLSVIAAPDRVTAIEEVLFVQTSTFGVRRHAISRTKLAREFREVATAFGMVRVKIGRHGGRVVTGAPEYEDCRRLAEEKRVPLKDVFAAAVRALSA